MPVWPPLSGTSSRDIQISASLSSQGLVRTRDGQGIRGDNFVCCLQGFCSHSTLQLSFHVYQLWWLWGYAQVKWLKQDPVYFPHISPYWTSCTHVDKNFVNKVTHGFQIHLVFGWGENQLCEHLPRRVPHLKYLNEYLFCRLHTIKWVSDMQQPLLFKSDGTRQQKEQMPA